jgi:hypothetical protein
MNRLLCVAQRVHNECVCWMRFYYLFRLCVVGGSFIGQRFYHKLRFTLRARLEINQKNLHATKSRALFEHKRGKRLTVGLAARKHERICCSAGE